jgi:hypothetical protein
VVVRDARGCVECKCHTICESDGLR